MTTLTSVGTPTNAHRQWRNQIDKSGHQHTNLGMSRTK
jgi:hypothetical protein